MRLLASIAVLCAAVVGASAQDREYGSPDEMKGITRIYIEAGNSVDLRNIMARVIEKRLPGVKVLGGLDGAELALVLNHEQLGRKLFAGELVALKPAGEKVRLLATYRHEEEELNDLADEIVKKFVKQYRSVNK